MSIMDAYISRIKNNQINMFHNSYNLTLLSAVDTIYGIAKQCRTLGYDPSVIPETEFAIDMSERIEKLLKTPIAERLRELLSQARIEQVALTIAEEIALGKFGYSNTEQLLDLATRAGLAVVTEGVTAVPLQGISSVKIKSNDDGSKYAAVSFAGPIRATGGTEAAFCVVIADRVRKALGLENYRANAFGEDEVGRMLEELRIYEREVGNFQFRVSDDDIKTVILHIPVEIDGVDTNPVEVTMHKGMKRINSDRVRGGALKVLNDEIVGKAQKLSRLLEDLSIDEWSWLSQLQGGKLQDNEENKSDLYFDSVIVGKPVLSKPGQQGGFRLRYGRSFNTGISAVGISPITAELLDFPIVVGTQVKMSIPGKAGTIAFVDTIDGPTVRLKNGSVIRVDDSHHVKSIKDKVESILFMGDILIGFGDFLKNNTKLPQSGYVEEFWARECETMLKTFNADLNLKEISTDRIKAILTDPLRIIPTFEEAVLLARELKIGLHPAHTFYWDLATPSEILTLRQFLKIHEGRLTTNENLSEIKTILEKIGMPHTIDSETITIEAGISKNIITVLALDTNMQIPSEWKDVCELLSLLAGFPIRRKSSAFIGIRVGRPEKATLRKMKPPAHTLFPVGIAGGPSRDLFIASKDETITIELANLTCEKCGSNSLSARCAICEANTVIQLKCPNCNKILGTEVCPACRIRGNPYSHTEYPIKRVLAKTFSRAHYRPEPPLRGVQTLTSSIRLPEPLEKGVLRNKYDLSVYKDGTIRFNATNAPLTHATAAMINVNIETLRKFGYERDVEGEPLTSEDQLFELFIQDIVIPNEAASCLFNVANFIDDSLLYIYKQKSFYELRSKEDLAGHLVIGLAPHTSAGIIGRIIGFTNSQVCFAHPFWHSAKRRDCDGDADSLILLLDVLLNFSKDYLPAQIGGLMDAPLMIQPTIIPYEIQQQACNLDVMQKYPLEFYEATKSEPHPSQITSIELVRNRLKDPEQFCNFYFTHSTSNIVAGHPRSSYSNAGSMAEKLQNQINLAKKITAVNPDEVVTSILKTHLLPDIIGNLRAYTSQSFRCKSCNSEYRRLPVKGECLDCGGELRSTVTRGTVEKYLKLATKLCSEFKVDEYTRNRLEVLSNELSMLFKSEGKPIQSDLRTFLE
jgi:DNA polymerase II large subunit